MKAVIHTGFAETLAHERKAKHEGRVISENNATWKYVNSEYLHDTKKSDVHTWKSERDTQAKHNRLAAAQTSQ